MRGVTGVSKRFVVAGTILAMLAASAACGGDNADPPSAAESSGSPHSTHGQVEAPAAAPLRDGERFVTLTMPRPYAPSAPNGGTDEYRCFLVDPKLADKAYLTGSQFLPQNAAIVHHAIFFRISPAGVSQARQLDERTPGEGWQCFGDSGVDGDGEGAWVAHWAPGANEVLLGQGLGYEMPPGAQLVMQVHYNLLATDTKAGGADQSSIRLRLADGGAGMTPLHTLLASAPVELPCTPRESGPLCDRAAAVKDVTHRFGEEVGEISGELLQWCSGGKPAPGPTQSCDLPAPGNITLYAAAGHMHLLGRAIKVELNPGSAGGQTLLDVPRYDFDDQAIRPLAAPVKVKKGDVVRVTCTHDASLRERLPQLKDTPPRYVVWGDGTSDEMCLGLLVGTRG